MSALASLHQELEGLVGRQGPVLRGTIGRRDMERFAFASGDRTRGEEAPPLLLSSILEWGVGPRLGELREDGTGVGREGWLPLDGLRLMGGGQDLIFHAPARAGTSFVAQPTLEGVELKQGAVGDLVLIVITTEFREEQGAALLTCRETLIAR